MKQGLVRALCSGLIVGSFTLGPPMVAAGPASGPTATVVFAGGCYWGVESVFRHVKGVTAAVSGFAVPVDRPATLAAGGPDYVEAVRVEYDPSQVAYGQLLEIFFLVAHDPTEIDRQGPDVGPQYRSVVFVDDTAQMRMVRSYIDHLTTGKLYPRPIVTGVTRLLRFRAAPPDQQNYAAMHEGEPYVIINDRPKLMKLKAQAPTLYRE